MRTLPRPIVLLHVKKAAGTTVRQHLRRWLPDARHVQFPGPEAWEAISDADLAETDVFTGHIGYRFLKRLPDAYTITVLRDPFERALSLYYFCSCNKAVWGERQPKFRWFVQAEVPKVREVIENGMVWQFAHDAYWRRRRPNRFPDPEALLRRAVRNLRAVDFVTFQETLDADLVTLRDALGLGDAPIPPLRANRSLGKPESLRVDPDTRAHFDEIAALDIRFVEAARRIVTDRGGPTDPGRPYQPRDPEPESQ